MRYYYPDDPGDPKSYMSSIPAWVVDVYGRMIKVQYDCPIEPHYLHGKQVWLKGKGEIGDPIKVYIHTTKNRFGERTIVPLTEEEHIAFYEKDHDEFLRLNRSSGDEDAKT